MVLKGNYSSCSLDIGPGLIDKCPFSIFITIESDTEASVKRMLQTVEYQRKNTMGLSQILH
jgi:hypothetical protein